MKRGWQCVRGDNDKASEISLIAVFSVPVRITVTNAPSAEHHAHQDEQQDSIGAFVFVGDGNRCNAPTQIVNAILLEWKGVRWYVF